VLPSIALSGAAALTNMTFNLHKRRSIDRTMILVGYSRENHIGDSRQERQSTDADPKHILGTRTSRVMVDEHTSEYVEQWEAQEYDGP
jgi:hypothetical protein